MATLTTVDMKIEMGFFLNTSNSEQASHNKSFASPLTPTPHAKFWRLVRTHQSIAPKTCSNASTR